MSQTQSTTQVLPDANSIPWQPIISYLTSGNGIMLTLALLGWLVIACFGGKAGAGKKKMLATARFASKAERNRATAKAERQMKARKHNEVALKIFDSIVLPDVQRGVAISGGAGSGKTASMILPMSYSAIEQGFPVFLYDFKYIEPDDSLVSTILPIAYKAGYEVWVFAPGMPESEICNPLEFLKDEMDGMAARQLASVMHKCMRSEHKDAADDPFFSIAGDLLIQAVLLLAKQTQFPDMMMCQAILCLSNLAERIQASSLSRLTKSTFAQFISVAGSEKTADSIRGTAQNLFVPFTTPGLANAFCGKTTIPLTLKEKQLVVVGMDKSIKTAIAPFLTGIMQMVLDLNVAKPRTDPFIFILDEAPTVGIDLATAFATQRSAGAITIMGYQDIGQLEQRYGQSLSRTILANCSTKAWFNPQEPSTAEWCSNYLGQEHILLKNRSKGASDGKPSTNLSEDPKTRSLYSADQFLRLPPGKCILVNPAISSRDEAGIPLQQQVKIPQQVKQRQEKARRLWNEKMRQRLIDYSPQPRLLPKQIAGLSKEQINELEREALRDLTEKMIAEREEEAERILPLPEAVAGKSSDKPKKQKPY